MEVAPRSRPFIPTPLRGRAPQTHPLREACRTKKSTVVAAAFAIFFFFVAMPSFLVYRPWSLRLLPSFSFVWLCHLFWFIDRGRCGFCHLFILCGYAIFLFSGYAIFFFCVAMPSFKKNRPWPLRLCGGLNSSDQPALCHAACIALQAVPALLCCF